MHAAPNFRCSRASAGERKQQEVEAAEPSGQSRCLGFPKIWRHQRASNDSPGQATLWKQEVLESKERRDVSPPEESVNIDGLLISNYVLSCEVEEMYFNHGRIRVSLSQVTSPDGSLLKHFCLLMRSTFSCLLGCHSSNSSR